jgi:hypothetical protein
MSSLQDRLDEFRRAFESGAPPYNVPHEAIKTMHRATAELKATGADNRALKVGNRAPGFTLFNRITCRWPRMISYAKVRWWLASSEDTGDRTA